MSSGISVIQAPGSDRAARTSPAKEYLAGVGFDTFGSFIGDTLADHARRMTRLHGDRLYDRMLDDATVSASIDTVKSSILAEGLQFVPGVTYEDVEQDDATTADADLAWEINEAWNRGIESLEEPFEDFCWQLLDGIPRGCMLGEQVMTYHEDGPDKGRWMISRAAVKPRDVWEFVCNPAGKVIGISGNRATPKTPSGRILDRRKFVVFSWLPRNGDPRGTPALDAVYEPWNLKTLLRPQYWLYLSQFASPSLFGTTAENEGDSDELDENGNPTGNRITPEEAFLSAIVRLRNGSALVGKFGSTLTALNPTGEGAAFSVGFDLFDRQIATGILHSARLILESQHSSRKDAESSQDTAGLLARVGKKSLAAAIRRDMIRPWVEMNWGADAARRLSPVCVMGLTEPQDFSRNAGAIARLAMAGMIPDEIKPKILTRFLGMSYLGRLSASIFQSMTAKTGKAGQTEKDGDEGQEKDGKGGGGGKSSKNAA